MSEFKDKVIVITGGTSGLGLELAKLLAPEGAKLVLAGIDLKKADKPSQACKSVLDVTQDASVYGIRVDVTDHTSVTAFHSEVQQKYGRVDILINSAGILKEGYFENLSEDAFHQVMNVNFFGLLKVIKIFLPMLKESQGRIVNIASLAGLEGVFGYTPYCSSKHAVVGLTKCLVYELAPQGVTVQMVCPGEFDSPMVDKLNAGRTPENEAHTLTIPKSSVQAIAKGIFKGMQTDKLLILPTKNIAFLSTFSRLFPYTSKKLAERKIRSVYQGPD